MRPHKERIANIASFMGKMPIETRAIDNLHWDPVLHKFQNSGDARDIPKGALSRGHKMPVIGYAPLIGPNSKFYTDDRKKAPFAWVEYAEWFTGGKDSADFLFSKFWPNCPYQFAARAWLLNQNKPLKRRNYGEDNIIHALNFRCPWIVPSLGQIVDTYLTIPQVTHAKN